MKRCCAFAVISVLVVLVFGALTPPAAAQRATLKVAVDGIERTALVDPGKDAATTPSPLVFAFHGGIPGAGGAANMTARGLSEAWPEATVVYPLSLQPLTGFDNVWQYLPGEADDRDVRFVDALLKAISATYKVDERRVFVTGFSDGAAMTDLLLMLRPERFAAFAPVSIWPAPHLKWARVPRSVLITHGTSDPLVFPELAEWARNQIQRLDGCSTEAMDWAPGSVSYQSCTSGQPVIYSLHSGGHQWTKSMPITANIVRFFKGQALPAPPAASSLPGDLDTSGTVAGSGRASFSGDGGSAIAAQLFFPEGVALDRSGGLFIADTGNFRIRKVTLDGSITTVAGSGDPGFNQIDSATRATRAMFFWPEGLVLDREGNLFIADTYHRLVRLVTPDGIVRTVAGSATQDVRHIGFSGDGGPVLQAELSFPTGLAVDSAGNLFIADTENHRVRKVGPDGNITTMAGTGTAGFSGDGGAATAAQLNEPWGLAVDSQDNVFIVDSRNQRIRKVRPDGMISTVFGSAATPPGYYPSSVAVDRAGNLLIADPLNHRIWKVSGVAAPGLLAGHPFPNP